jgi:hypothetical protein
MEVIYIAGRYRDERGEFYVEANIREAEQAALHIWLSGAVALCPHMNTRHFGGAFGIKDSTWLAGDLELLKRCDAIYMMPGWDSSRGATGERDFAVANNIPVLYDQADVRKFLKEEL